MSRSYKHADVANLKSAMEGAHAVSLVDVRTSGEFGAKHIDGAVNVPLGSLEAHLDQLSKTKPVWVICASGNRSKAGAKLMADAGVRATHVQGGMGAWKRAGYPIVRGAPRFPVLPLLASLSLGLAPFSPEPHVVGKVRWVLGGAEGMGGADWFDLVMHGAPWVWLAWALLGYVRGRLSSR